ncbi:cytochrome P450 [Oerskovia turbata]|uniref:Cytochrome P450 n=1 Tax=Oerskovia turbata TaxID=1713 RepID=A0A4Q1KMW7_9CELL|nr:cytochrome P450 [Oerskovia turbata]RXR26390.1 cytochrome P450 [Oerskovia turbata]RXR30549.1 cytochrome P450 [Oerskovia turbata]
MTATSPRAPGARSRTVPVAERAAHRWEERVQRGAHPLVYPAFRALARRGPVVRVPGLGVVVNDAATAREVLLDTEHFSKVGPGAPSDLWTPVLGPSVLLNMEGEDHATLRRALSGLFTPRSVAQLTQAEAGMSLGTLAPRLLAGETVDLVREVGALAGTVICRMTGLPPTDAAVRDAMVAAQSVVGLVRLHRRSLTPAQVRYAREVLGTLSEPARAAYRDGDPATVPGRMRGLGLSEREALGAVGAFVMTGTETIQSFTPRLVALAVDTGWMDRLLLAAPDDALRGRVVEEALRVTVPTPAMLRSVRSAHRVGDVPVRAGDRVVVATVTCCRADGTFDPARDTDPALRNLWFGAGPHFCLGMPLAMAQVGAVLDALRPVADAGRTLQVVGREVARGVLIPSYRRLRVASAASSPVPVEEAP